MQSKSEDTNVENRFIDTKGEKENEMNWEVEINTYALLCIKKITNEDLLCSTGKPTKVLCDDTNGKEL